MNQDVRSGSDALAEYARCRLLADLFGGSIEPRTAYPVPGLADAYGIDPLTMDDAVERLRADALAVRAPEDRVAFHPWTTASMWRRAVDLGYLAAHTPVRTPPPAPLVDLRAAAGPADLEAGLQFASRLLDVPGHARTARAFERSAAVFAAYVAARVREDAALAEALQRFREALVRLLDAPYATSRAATGSESSSTGVVDRLVVVKQALLEYVTGLERLAGRIREAPSAPGASASASRGASSASRAPSSASRAPSSSSRAASAGALLR